MAQSAAAPASAGLKRTPLYDLHVELGARLVPFAGFEMPVQYPAGVIAEHRAVRTAAGLFDVSHMGEFMVRGPQALELVNHVTTNDAGKLAVGQAQYSGLLNDGGTFVDDCLVYRFADEYMLVVNASNVEQGCSPRDAASRPVRRDGGGRERPHRAARAAGAHGAGRCSRGTPNVDLDAIDVLPLRRRRRRRHAGRHRLAHRLHR